jgi:hypothetical protein
MPEFERKRSRIPNSQLVKPVRPKRMNTKPAPKVNPLQFSQPYLGNQVAQRFAQSHPLTLPAPSVCSFGSACQACPTKVKAKLVLNEPGDTYEQEADRVADKVMRMSEPL